jgi:Flp pilus assembly protein TadG
MRRVMRSAARRRGSTMVEMALVGVLLFLLLLAAVEFGRMVLVYTNVANSARVGVRYAIVHGSTNTGTGAAGPNGPGATTEIVNVVKDYAKSGLLDRNRMTITVTYPDGGLNSPGSQVSVRVTYPYDPLSVLPLGVTLGSQTTGVITF